MSLIDDFRASISLSLLLKLHLDSAFAGNFKFMKSREEV